MSAQYDVAKSSAESVVTQAYDGIAAGTLEVLADERTRDLKSRLSTDAEDHYPWLHSALKVYLGS